MSNLQDKKKNRWLMLWKIYDINKGKSHYGIVNYREVGNCLGWNKDIAEETFEYLVNEKLLKSFVGGGATITHQGIKEVEKAEDNPSQPTSYFPAIIYINQLVQGNNTKAIMNNSTGDTYNVSGQAGAVGKNANATNNNFFQSQREKQTLAEAVKEIEQLLKQLEKTYPTATEEDKIAYINDETSPSFKRRTAGALKALGESVLDEYVLNPHSAPSTVTLSVWRPYQGKLIDSTIKLRGRIRVNSSPVSLTKNN